MLLTISSIRDGVMSRSFVALSRTSASDIEPKTCAPQGLSCGSRSESISPAVSPNKPPFGSPCARHMSAPPGSTRTGSPFASETTLSNPVPVTSQFANQASTAKSARNWSRYSASPPLTLLAKSACEPSMILETTRRSPLLSPIRTCADGTPSSSYSADASTSLSACDCDFGTLT